MTAYFLDSSALVKRYVPEIGSAWINALADPATNNLLFIARITSVEVRSAVARRVGKYKSLSSADETLIIQKLAHDLKNQYQVVEFDATLADAACQLASAHYLRGYDAVQLASALRIQPILTTSSVSLVFLTADKELEQAARNEGLHTDNPNNHP